MGCQIVSSDCHPAERKNGDFLSSDCHPTERSWIKVGHVSGSFILRSTQQDEALHLPFSRVYDHSLLHSRLATSDVEGE
ncbi:unnamed protein product [Spirodela intermedia]|uniref:Uncharacterized protein n=1 Tax=Spirodela intermedia TaxID=51605 RepID=A0A7I8KPK6_SPIIN|nr:unnamed protein product [Spirodela intermedia]